MMHGYGMNYGWMGIGWIFQVAILVLFFLVLWWILRNSQGFSYRTDESASEILKKRMARGEIDEKEYQKLKKEIED